MAVEGISRIRVLSYVTKFMRKKCNMKCTKIRELVELKDPQMRKKSWFELLFSLNYIKADDISLVLNVRSLCVVVDSLISAAKVCDSVISGWCWQAELRYVIAWLSCCTKTFPTSHKKVSSLFSLADCASENQFWTHENWISASSFSGLLALNHRPGFADKKVMILCIMFQSVVYSMRNPVIYRTAKKVVFCWLFKLLRKH